MANTLANIARVVSATTGTGTLTLGSAVTGFNTFADAGLTDGQTVTYAIEDYTGSDVTAREVGTGVFNTAGPTLTRATVYSSTSSGAKINCSGSQQVFITVAKEDLATYLTSAAADALFLTQTEADALYLTPAAASAAYQPLDSDLTTLSTNITAFGHSLVDDANAAAGRTTLGLGTAAVQNTGTSGTNVPLLDGNNTWSGTNKFTAQLDVEFATVSARFAATSGDALLPIGSGSGNYAGHFLSTGTAVGSLSRRWLIGKNNSAEAGSNSGSAFIIAPYDDSGNYLGLAFALTRSNFAADFYGGVAYASVSGGNKGAGTANFTTLYEAGTSLATKYQGLDSELTAIAGLTSAADRLPYFTGSGTASLATFTAAGRALIDDADASAQRTTLGLGTAAVQNTGTSGTNVPLLDGTNTWSGVQTTSTTTAGASTAVYIVTDAGSAIGPILTLRRVSTSPAANDFLGQVLFQGRNSVAGTVQYASFLGQIQDETSGSEDGALQIATLSGGASANRLAVGAGVVVGAPTGSDTGVGTLNAVTLYENGTSLASKYGAIASANVFTAAQTVRIDNATTNAVTVAATLSHTTSGTPATGIGVGLNFEAETSAGNNEIGAQISAVTTDVTAASEDFDLVFSAMAAGAAAAEVGRITSKGTYKHKSFTVAGLPAGTAGETCFASNGRKNGEGAGAGTGVLVFHDGTNWCACDTGAAVAA